LDTRDNAGWLGADHTGCTERWFGVKPAVTPELRQIILDDIEVG
jgi:hypothetical protein